MSDDKIINVKSLIFKIKAPWLDATTRLTSYPEKKWLHIYDIPDPDPDYEPVIRFNTPLMYKKGDNFG